MLFVGKGESRQEARRVHEPTTVANDDADLIAENETDTLEPSISGAIEPKVKITTSGDNEHPLIPFGEVLQQAIPHALFERRDPGATLTDVIKQAEAEEYTDLLVLVEAKNEVHSLMHLHLPNGPCASYRLTSLALPRDIPGHAKISSHYPEIILKHFSTHLGKLCSRMLRAIFPAAMEPHGRRVITFHHQRDFIFFRHYRYIYDSPTEVRLQECGPKFTLKLQWLQEGPYDPSNGLYTYYRRPRHDKVRTKFPL